jgi:hypothetical protein
MFYFIIFVEKLQKKVLFRTVLRIRDPGLGVFLTP